MTNNNAQHNEPSNSKVRLPSAFNGKSDQCNTFFSQLAVYFAANPSYNTDGRRAMLAISCVTGPLFAFLEPFIAQMDQLPKPKILTNYAMLSSDLINAFSDSNPVITAETQLRSLHRENLPFSIYATRFRMYAQQVEWNHYGPTNVLKEHGCALLRRCSFPHE
ncbi:uncharacterized protein ATC70_000250 [Mucor velutinosus]|uniref:Retrotransposon gag domain-containing protein n=1 Tax=Mucor velutinosus TaxID=708070 RepID=A0AAN7I1Q8_9FUNG|nr:hypothetical protein ATC70_000250 [Mucor velutinosus]